MMSVSKKKDAFESFSEKQLRVLSWWCPSSPDRNFDAIICDGAVRSGKTLCMSVSFVAWAFSAFDDTSFALCGKTVTSLRRNIITPILPVLRRLGFDCREKLSQHLVEIEYSGRRNRFYLFGGKDEGSAALIQGMTLGGVLLDEVALMPRSFVEQALARCSLDGSKLWFNCNPDTPLHWFYEEWIKKSAEKNCLYLHFTMDDNPSLTPAIKRRYESLYSGAFYDRFVLGKWVAAQGLVYPFFSRSVHVAEPEGIPSRYFISCDYGTVNPSSFGLWGEYGGRWYRLNEYYFQTMHHEFAHILHQTKNYDPAFDRITENAYIGSDWYMVGANRNAWQQGFVTSYAMSESREDFVENIAVYVTNTKDYWNNMLQNAGENGRALIKQKFEIVYSYMEQTWGINLDELRDIVLRRQDDIANGNVDLSIIE